MVVEARTAQMVYRFSEGDASMGDLLGGKGSNLCEMMRLGLPVPPGFVITTQVCRDYLAGDYTLPEGLAATVRERIGELEKAIGHDFGSATNPLLVSVRSGARISMPGMMDTILNLGINDDIVEGLGEMMGDRRPAWDAYRRFVQIYAEVVQEVAPEPFEECLAEHKARAGVELDYELTAEQLQAVTVDFKEIARRSAGSAPPDDPWEQLFGAMEAVFRSWNNPRATVYRNQYGIDHDMGTAVTIMGDGVREPGADERDGSAVHAQPVDGTAGGVRRVPEQRAGRGRCRGSADTGAAVGAGRGDARTVGRTAEAGEQPGKAIPRHAGRGIHHRAGAAIPAADAERQADATVVGEDGGGHGSRGDD